MWKIKDPELKRKVNQFFTDEEINAECKRCINDEDSEFLSFFMDGIDIQFHIRKGYFEEVPEYNPDDWNPYPTVTPPVDGKKWLTQDEDGNLAIRSFTRSFEEGIDYSWEDHDDRLIVAFRSLPAPYQPETNK